MTRKQRIAIFGLAGLATGIVLALVALYVLTRTPYGLEKVRRYAVKWLDDQVIGGSISIEKITGAGLLGGLTLHKFAIMQEDSTPFVDADSMVLEYNWRTLLGGEIKLDAVKLYRPRLLMQQLPGDTAWNYEYIFRDTTPSTEGTRKLIEFENAEVFDALVTIRRPLDTDERIEVEDTARLLIETLDQGKVKVMRFDSVFAELERVTWESPIEKGRLFHVRRVSGLAYVWKEPARIRRLEGRVTTRDTIIAFDLPAVEFGGSKAGIVGRVIQAEGQNVFDVLVDGQTLVFNDLLWLYPKLPAGGRASLQLRIQTQPKGILWYASNARINAPGTVMAGRFGVVTGDTMYFTDVALTASPLNLELLEDILPGKLPVQGLMVGTVEVKGPISSLDMKGDIQLTQPGGGKPSGVRWQGLFDTRTQWAASNFEADVQDLDLAVLNALRPELKLKGVVNGRVAGSAVSGDRYDFAAALQHELAGLSSSFEGKGTYSVKSRQLDLKLDALPLSLPELAAAYPALKRLRGEARGPIKLTGPTNNLAVEAKLATEGGELDFRGTLQLREGRRRYAGEGRLSAFQLDRVLYDLPSTNVTGKLQFDLTGTSSGDATGTARIELGEARLAGVLLADVKADARVAGGMLNVDSLRARTSLGQLTATGDFGITDLSTGLLRFAVRSDSIIPLGEARTITGGQLEGSGTVQGGISGFDLSAEAMVLRALYARANAKRARVQIAGQKLTTDSAAMQLTVIADSANLYGAVLDSVRAELVHARSGGTILFNGVGTERSYFTRGDFRTDSAGAAIDVRELNGGTNPQPWALARPFSLKLSRLGLQADSFALRQTAGTGIASGFGRLAWTRSRADSVAAARQPLDFTLALQRVPLEDYLRFVKSKTTTGTADGSLRITGTAGEPIIDATADVTNLAYGDARFDRLSGSFAYSEHRIAAALEGHQRGRQVLSGSGQIPLDLGFVPLDRRRLDEALEFTVRTDSLPVVLLTSLTNGFRNVAGNISGHLDFRGTTRDPTMAGLLTLRGGAATYASTGVRYREAQGSFRVLNDSLVAIDASARAGEGNATLRGRMVFSPLGNPRFDSLTIVATNFTTARRRDAELIMTGRLFLGGRFDAPVLSGGIAVDRGTLYLDELYRQTQIVELDPSRSLFFDVVDTSLVAVKRVLPASTSPFIRNLVVQDLTVDVARESWLRSRNLNVEVSGLLRVNLEPGDPSRGRTAEDVRLIGELRAVRGTYQMEYRLFKRRFEIREGTIDFPGTPGVDPNLEITALYRARPPQEEPIDILALVTGTLRTPRVGLSSDANPPKSESDLASYLFFGVPTSALSLAQSRTLDSFSGGGGTGGAMKELGLSVAKSSTLGYLAGGLESIAQSYDLLDYVSLTASEGGTDTRNSGLVSLFANTQLELGRYWAPNVFMVYSRRLGTSATGLGGVRMEWRFHPTYTMEAFAEDRFARGTSIGIENSAAFRKVYGFFLFREWSY
ncbi:MAG: translocation/assembly module TamB [Gemmatimonadota bacterium]